MRCYPSAIWTALLLTAVGCGTDGAFPVATVTGTVLCDGKPVPHAMVFFEPLPSADKSALAGKQGLAVADENGKFVVSTYGEQDGAVVGKHRVRVGAPNREMYPDVAPCPCELNSETDVMEVEVKDGEKNEFQVVLKKKPNRAALSLDEQEALEEARQAQAENRN